jgi:hypothetical protein
MKFRKYIFLFIIVILLFSCNKKQENNNETKQENFDETVNKKVLSEENENEKERIKEIIYKNDDYFKNNKEKIIYIEKGNFGIPGGDNWKIKLDNSNIFIYLIIDDKIIKRYIETVSRIYVFNKDIKKYNWENENTEEKKWYYYTWDEERNEFIEIDDIDEFAK